MDSVDVVLANNDRATLRVGDTFLKVDADRARAERERQAIGLAPVPTPDVLWHRPPVLALAALSGETLGRLGEPATASPAAWSAAGAVIRRLHDAPLPPWTGKTVNEVGARLRDGCDWLIANDVLPHEVVEHNRAVAEAVVRPWVPAFTHGDLHLEHLFVENDEVVGIIDWSEAAQGDPLYDIASLTLGNEERLEDFLAGYGGNVDRSVIRGWWSWRCLVAIRWLTENGYGEPGELPEAQILHARHRGR